MSKPNVVHRNYTISDSEMVVASNVYRALFIEDKSDFSQFDSSFADPYADNWGAAITLAETVAQDAELIDQMAQLTTIVNLKMKEAHEYYQRIKYYFEKAFADSISIQNEFGRNDYEKARNSTPKLVAFMQNLSKAILKYNAQLLTSGCSQEFLDEAPNLLNELRTAENNQELFKKTRPVKTQKRLEDMNSCWDYSKNVCKAGKIIYSSNAAKYNQYLLPGEAPKAAPVPEPDS
jgi:vacuolar-type H+-ATPase catalytic subunit A/Vma1